MKSKPMLLSPTACLLILVIACPDLSAMADAKSSDTDHKHDEVETGTDAEAESIAREEAERLRQLLDSAASQRAMALEQAGRGESDVALAGLDRAVAALPVNPLTEAILADLQRDKANVRMAKSRARLSDEDRASEAGNDRLILRGRSQYLAGDFEGAEKTFHELARRDPKNAEVQSYLERIATDRREGGNRQRVRTREELLGEVDRSWRRPGVFRDQASGADGTSELSPLARKLEEIILPSVSFTRVEIGRVVTALSAASVEYDRRDAERRGVNIVLLDPSGKAPELTLTLRDTNLKRALDFITEAVGYQYEIQADAVVVRPGGEAAALDTAFFPVSRATVLRMTGVGGGAVPGSGRPGDTVPSQFGANTMTPGGEAQAVRSFLQQAGVNFEGVAGSSLAFDGSAIIVTQSTRNLDRICNILKRYHDIRQVEIEAKFMEVQEGALEELGVNWNVATRATQQNARVQARYLTDNRSLAAAFSSTSANQQGRIVRPEGQSVDSEGGVTFAPELDIPIINNAPQIPGTAHLGAGANALANLTGVIGEFDINAIVRALAQKQGTDLLSAPKVTVLSGNPATITVAQELRYPQRFGQTQSQVGTGNASGGGSAGVAITAGTPEEFATRNVGVELKVTPTVEEDDYSISLELNPKVTEFDGFVEYGGPSVAISGSTTVTVPSGFYQPIFSVRDISTKVTIWDGATLIMGGLTREEVKKVSDKVPVLGDIPLLGRMFRSKSESAQKRNLLIFVTANLVSPGGAPKKQVLENVPPGSLYQNPTVITPSGAEARTR